MSEEIFDVVNEKDEVIDQRPRSEVHRLGLHHRAVHLFLFNARSEVFLQKRSKLKDNHPSVWDSSASGHLDSGEDYDPCVMRECAEELGVRLIEQPERLYKVDSCAATGQEFVWLYRGNHEGPFKLQESEVETGGWFAPENVDRWIECSPGDFAPAFVMLWKMYREAD